jgi:cytochrome oxidase assembly protein ShyY1
MRHPILEQHLKDREFQRRVGRQDLALLLMLLPLLVFAALTYLEIGFVPPVALTCAAACYAVLSFLCTWQMRRSTLKDLRREGVAEQNYHPPED